MKVCFLNHTLDDATGAGHFARSLIRALIRAEPAIEPLVLTAVASGDPDERTLLAAGRVRFVSNLRRIRAAIREANLTHALDGYPYGVLAALAAIGLARPLVITAIGTGAAQAFKRPVAGRLLSWSYRRADRVVAVSSYTSLRLASAVPGLSPAVVNHGVDAGEFSAAAPVSPAERLRIDELKPYVLSVGAHKPRKGFAYSLAAFAGLAPRFPHLRYVIVGEGEHPDLDREIARRHLRERVIFFEKVSRPVLRALYQNAELFWLLPYDDGGDVEGFGLVFLEAAAAGIPVVAASGSGSEDAVAAGQNAFLVAPRDALQAAKAAASILGDKALRARLSAGSRLWAREKSWDAAARSYLQLYRELLAGQSPSGL